MSRFKYEPLRVLALLTGSFASAILSFGTQLVCARAMQVPDYGQLAASLAAVNIAGVFGAYGIGNYWLQIFGSKGEQAFTLIGKTVKLLVITSVLSWLFLLLYETRIDDVVGVSALFLLPIFLSQSLAETTNSRFQLEERFSALAIWQALTPLFRFCASIILFALGLVSFRDMLTGYALISIPLIIFSVIVLYKVNHRQIRLAGYMPRIEQQREAFWDVVVGATPYCFCTLFYMVYASGVVIVTERVFGGPGAAHYNAAYLVIAAVFLVPGVIYSKYLLSKIFRWSAHDSEMFAAVIHLGVAVGFVTGLLCMVFVWLTAGWVIFLLFGPRYDDAVVLLQLLAIGIPIRFVQHAYGAAFFSTENMHRKMWFLGAAACICIGLSLVLFPLVGLKGAALASVGSELGLLGLFMYGVNRYVKQITLSSTLSIRGIYAALQRVMK